MGERTYHDIVDDLFDDPECTGDLLLLCLAIARISYADERGKVSIREIEKLTGLITAQVKGIIRTDTPAYRPPPRNRAYRCTVILPRAKRECGRSSSYYGKLRDAGDGTWVDAVGCSRHRDEVEAACRASWVAWTENGQPEPEPNSGGILMRHFTAANWDHLYSWANFRDITVTPRPSTPRAPKLRLILGGA